MTMTENRPVTAAERVTGGLWLIAPERVGDMVAAIRGLAMIAGDPVRSYDVIGFTVSGDGSCHMAVTDSYRALRVEFPAGTVADSSAIGSVGLVAAELVAAVKNYKPDSSAVLSFSFAGLLPVDVTCTANGSSVVSSVVGRDVAAHLTPGGIDRLIPEPCFEGSRFDVGRFGDMVRAIGTMCGVSRKREVTFTVHAMSERKPCHVSAMTAGGMLVDGIIMPIRK